NQSYRHSSKSREANVKLKCWSRDLANAKAALVDPQRGGRMPSSESQGALDPSGIRLWYLEHPIKYLYPSVDIHWLT
ncbi:jg27220, partial [Pararge aegeria aegeria]